MKVLRSDRDSLTYARGGACALAANATARRVGALTAVRPFETEPAIAKARAAAVVR